MTRAACVVPRGSWFGPCSRSCPGLGKQHVGATASLLLLALENLNFERNSLVLWRHVLLLLALRLGASSESCVCFARLRPTSGSPAPQRRAAPRIPKEASVPMTMMRCVLVPEHWISFAAEIIYDEICITLPSNKGNALRFALLCFSTAACSALHLLIGDGCVFWHTAKKT